MATLGALLREAREARGYTLEEVNRQTHIQLKHLEALEAEQFSDLPAEAYTRGFVKNYARFVGLSPEELVAAYEAALNPASGRRLLRPATPAGSPPAQPMPTAPQRTPSRMDRPVKPPEGIHITPLSPNPINTRLRYPPSGALLSGLAIVALIAVYLFYNTYSSSLRVAPTPTVLPVTPTTLTAFLPTVLVSQTPVWTPFPTPGPSPLPTEAVPPTAVVAAAPTPPPGATAPVDPPPASPVGSPVTAATPVQTPTPNMAGTITIEISIPTAPVWFRVFADEVKVFEGTLPRDTVRAWTGTRSIRIRTGRADIVRIRVNGVDRGLMGSSKQTVVTKEWDVNGKETIVQ